MLGILTVQEDVLMESLPYLLDLIGTFVFALSGGMAGVKRKLDLFGVLVLSFAAATAGGIARDVLIGAIPPEGLNNWRYVGVSLSAGLVMWTSHGHLGPGLHCCKVRHGRSEDCNYPSLARAALDSGKTNLNSTHAVAF